VLPGEGIGDLDLAEPLPEFDRERDVDLDIKFMLNWWLQSGQATLMIDEDALELG
tara:strand:+ start:642 stop:806 length:165 start_codon:yes stop_codon:yes gene_type:complete